MTIAVPLKPSLTSQALWRVAISSTQNRALVEAGPFIDVVFEPSSPENRPAIDVVFESWIPVLRPFQPQPDPSRTMGGIVHSQTPNADVVRRAGVYGGGLGAGFVFLGGAAAACAAGVVDGLMAVLGLGITLAIVGLTLLFVSAARVRSLDRDLG